MFHNVVTRIFFLALVLFCSTSLADIQVPKDVVLVLDNSGSMKKNDPELAAKAAVMGFIADMRGDTRLSILVFDDNVRYYFPLTIVSDQSRYKFTEFVNKINYKGLFTNSYTALESAIEELSTRGRNDARKTIVFLTDGIVDTGDRRRDMESVRRIQSELNIVAQRKQIKIFTIAFTYKADVDMLLALADSTGGKLLRAQRADQLFSVFYQFANEINQDAVEQSQESRNPAPIQLTEQPKPNRPVPVQEPVQSISTPATDKSVPNTYLSTEQKDPSIERPLNSSPQSYRQPLASGTGESVPISGFYFSIALLVGILLIGITGLTIALVRRQRGIPLSSLNDVSEHENSGRPEAYLIAKTDILPNQTYKITCVSTLIGRTCSTPSEHMESLIIDRKSIGRRHAIIEYEQHGYWLIDLKSVNGTFVNGKRITDKIRLTHGDRIEFHDIEFRFAIPSLVKADKTAIGGDLLPNIKQESNRATENIDRSVSKHMFPLRHEEYKDLGNEHDMNILGGDSDEITRLRPQSDNPAAIVTNETEEYTPFDPSPICGAGTVDSPLGNDKEDLPSIAENQDIASESGKIDWYQDGSLSNPYAEDSSDEKPDSSFGDLVDEYDTEFKPPDK